MKLAQEKRRMEEELAEYLLSKYFDNENEISKKIFVAIAGVYCN